MKIEYNKNNTIFKTFYKWDMRTFRCTYFHIVLITWIIFFCNFSASAQFPELRFKHLNVEHGLSQSTVRAIFQDKNGFMWFGTDIGINKFDGSEFTVYRYNATDTNGISSNFIIEILEDSYGKFWIGTGYAGLSRFDRGKEIFYNYTYKPGDPTSLSNNNIRAIFEDSKKNLWIGTAGGGLNLYDRDNDSFTQITHKPGGKPDIGSNYISAIAEDSKGNLWLGSPEGTLTRFNPITGENHVFNLYSNNVTDVQTTTFGQVTIDSEDNVWFCTENGLYLYDQNKSDFSHFSKGPAGRYLNENAVSDIEELGNGLYLIATDHGGINIYDKKNGKFSYHMHSRFEGSSISNNQLYNIYRTIDGIIWVGNFNGGVNIYDPNARKFDSYTDINLAPGSSFNEGSVLSLCEDGERKIWIGYDGQGIDIFDPFKGIVRHLKSEPGNHNSIPSNSIVEIYKTRNGDMWIGSYLKGLTIIRHRTGKYEHFRHVASDQNTIGGNNVWSILEDKEGMMWMGFQGNGLDRYDRETNTFIHYKHNPDDLNSLPNNDIYKIFEDRDGKIWISTRNGLCRYNRDSDNFTRYVSGQDIVNGIYGKCIYDIYQDARGTIWVGSDQALNKYDAVRDVFVHFQEKDGMAGIVVLSITGDDKDNLWISTNNGISRFNTETLVFRNFDVADGLLSNEFNYVSVLNIRDNILFFGGKSGFNFFDPSGIVDNQRIPPVYFTSMRIFSEEIRPNQPNGVLNNHINFTDKITLSHKQTVFSVGFAALNFTNPQKNQYSYMLEGFDDDWIYLGNRHEITYTSLDPGRYFLRVRGSNSDGIWNEEGALLQIVINPPWWKSWWFRILAYISAVAILLAFYIFRLRFYDLQKKKLMVLVRERTFQLEDVAVALEEKQEEINSQNEKLVTQRNELEQSNKLLTEQKIQILDQNKELDLHRNRLETLIDERTKELIEAKNKAEESDRLKSSFLANLSHEIRTPLNAILGFSSLLGEKNLNVAEKEEYNRIIQGSSNNLLDLINDILDISKIEAGQLELDMRQVLIDDLINTVTGIFEMFMKREDSGSKKQVQLMVAVNPELRKMQIIADQLRITQVLTNLINNAIKFTSRGFIEIGCYKKPGEEILEFYVKDTGIGIKEANQDLVFERFRKLEDDRIRLHRGTGLGLAISRQLVNLMGGIMRLESSYGEGSTFYFTIPLIAAGLGKPAEKDGEIPGVLPDFKNSRIIVAEDEISNFNYISTLLTDAGAEVLHASTGNEVLQLLENNIGIDLILMDIKMPTMNGIEALHALRKKGFKVPVIAQTAYALADEVVKLKMEGFDEYISKPIQRETLYAVMQKCLSCSGV
jgi:signal transduction histidine kinase/ligand-binding sensor domain-containing protein/CheY-like chemotaxis protein